MLQTGWWKGTSVFYHRSFWDQCTKYLWCADWKGHGPRCGQNLMKLMTSVMQLAPGKQNLRLEGMRLACIRKAWMPPSCGCTFIFRHMPAIRLYVPEVTTIYTHTHMIVGERPNSVITVSTEESCTQRKVPAPTHISSHCTLETLWRTSPSIEGSMDLHGVFSWFPI